MPATIDTIFLIHYYAVRSGEMEGKKDKYPVLDFLFSKLSNKNQDKLIATAKEILRQQETDTKRVLDVELSAKLERRKHGLE